jgi:hypothetical protein
LLAKLANESPHEWQICHTQKSLMVQRPVRSPPGPRSMTIQEYPTHYVSISWALGCKQTQTHQSELTLGQNYVTVAAVPYSAKRPRDCALPRHLPRNRCKWSTGASIVIGIITPYLPTIEVGDSDSNRGHWVHSVAVHAIQRHVTTRHFASQVRQAAPQLSTLAAAHTIKLTYIGSAAAQIVAVGVALTSLRIDSTAKRVRIP